ncbi:MAG: YqcC family protein [Halomonadaceae bacterium]|nr:MAG: YqcC family protein [Halomonadaceae bacterium]
MRSDSIDLAITDCLLAIAQELQQLDLWQQTPPAASDLASQQPFCVDTLTFQQWLQFVLLPQVQQLIDAGQPLPAAAAIAPMAEESFRHQAIPAAVLVNRLRELDRLISDNP